MSGIVPPPTSGAVAPPREGQQSHSSRSHAQDAGRHVVELLAVSALGLVPWTVVLGLTLPSDYRVHAGRTAWVGFGVLLLAGMAATAVLDGLHRRLVVIPALVTAVLLVCDAWFDVSLDLGTSGVWTSAALAVFVELPMAVFLFRKAYALLRVQGGPIQDSDPSVCRSDEPSVLASMSRRLRLVRSRSPDRHLGHRPLCAVS
jgi:hypothetical protein